MEDMPRKLPLHVTKERTRHGKVKFYFRLYKGPRIRLPDDPDSIEFKEAYKLALTGRQHVAPSQPETTTQSLRWLIERYKESRAWGKLNASTRGDRDGIFTKVIDKSKNVSFLVVDKVAINQAMDDRQDHPAAANNFLKAMRGLFEWAKANNHVKSDPTEGIKFNRLETDGFKPWAIEDYLKFQAKYPIGTKARLAIELLIHSGLRHRRQTMLLPTSSHRARSNPCRYPHHRTSCETSFGTPWLCRVAVCSPMTRNANPQFP